MTEPVPPDPYGIEALRNAKANDEVVAILAAQYRLLVAPDQIVERRALDVQRSRERPHTEAGFFDWDHIPEMVKAALGVTLHARGVYFTLNPIKPDLLARHANRIAWAAEGQLAKDKDVIARRWLLVDADPVRDPHISASDEEKAHALDTAQAVRAHLAAHGWPQPILADSGNGYHLLYRVDLPADDDGEVEHTLRALAAQFDSDHVKIDQKVYNPGRICKLPGTLARKGDSIASRPHRRATLLEVPRR